MKFFHLTQTSFLPNELIIGKFQITSEYIKSMLRRHEFSKLAHSISKWSAAQTIVEKLLEDLRPENKPSRINTAFAYAISPLEENLFMSYLHTKDTNTYEVKPIGNFGIFSVDILNIMVCALADGRKNEIQDSEFFKKFCDMYWNGEKEYEDDNMETLATTFQVIKEV